MHAASRTKRFPIAGTSDGRRTRSATRRPTSTRSCSTRKERRIHGARHYVDCGPVILALLDPTGGGEKPKPSPDYLYFSVKEIEKFHARARKLGCLSKDKVHEESGGDILTRPWGERSFYADDPFGNGLCFVDARTIFTGR